MQPCLKALTHHWPFVVENAEHHGVAHEPIWLDAVLAESAFVLGTEFPNRGLAVDVAAIGFELHALHSELLEGEFEEQELAFRINLGSLPFLAVPCHTNLDATLIEAHVEVSGAADVLAGFFELDRPRSAAGIGDEVANKLPKTLDAGLERLQRDVVLKRIRFGDCKEGLGELFSQRDKAHTLTL